MWPELPGGKIWQQIVPLRLLLREPCRRRKNKQHQWIRPGPTTIRLDAKNGVFLKKSPRRGSEERLPKESQAMAAA